MQGLFFSASTGGFYTRNLHGASIPADAVPVDSDQHANLIEAQAAGARIVAGPDGQPVAEWPAPPTLADRKAAAIQTANGRAAHYRKSVADGADTDRALAWMLGAAFAQITVIHAGIDNPAIAAMVRAAQAGFAAEAAITGENPADLIRKTLDNSSAYFVRTKIVEGMQRLASHVIPAAQTDDELTAAIARLTAAEASAVEQFAAAAKGTKNG